MDDESALLPVTFCNRASAVLSEAIAKTDLIKELLVSSASSGPRESIGNSLAYRKMLNDIMYVIRTYSDLRKELNETRTFVTLKEAVVQGEIEQEAKKEYIALYHGRKWKQKIFEKGDRITNLKKQLQTLHNETSQFCAEKDEQISVLREEIKDAVAANPHWEIYEKKLAEVSLENLKLRLHQKEDELHSQLLKINDNIPKENKAHETMVFYLQISCEKLAAKNKFWEEKFSADSAEMQEKINHWEAEIEKSEKEVEELTEEQERYQKIIEEHLEEQERRREEQEETERRWVAAVSIQSQWRGWKVRRALAAANKRRSKKRSRK